MAKVKTPTDYGDGKRQAQLVQQLEVISTKMFRDAISGIPKDYYMGQAEIFQNSRKIF